MMGAAVTTSALAVGSRCLFAEAGLGVVLSQHRTDPRLGRRGLALLAEGKSAGAALQALVEGTPHHAWRQLAVLDRDGTGVPFTGARVLPAHAELAGASCVALGNILRNDQVVPAMVESFTRGRALPLPARLVAALAAGLAAGGEVRAITSSALLVVADQPFPYVDLRVDDHPEPIGELQRLWERYAPSADEYVQRAIDPEGALMPERFLATYG